MESASASEQERGLAVGGESGGPLQASPLSSPAPSPNPSPSPSPSPDRDTPPPPLDLGELESSGDVKAAVFGWKREGVVAWLKEIGMGGYESRFKKHSIKCGETLLSLTEEHLKEMGVVSVGDRLELSRAIEGLRKKCGLVLREKYLDTDHLLSELMAKQLQNAIRRYPKRIILIRHGESEGNVDKTLYVKKPDAQMELTPLGIKQAQAASLELKKILQDESVCFYVSPFLRSRQTFQQLKQAFRDDQVCHVREEPRIREQEWGNFKDADTVTQIREERLKVGPFYYRFLTGESGADVYDRVSTFLETLYRDMRKGGCGENAIIVSHGFFCRLFLMRFFHWTVEKFHKIKNFENCQFVVMEKQDGGRYQLISELKYRA